MRISDWSSDVCSSDLLDDHGFADVERFNAWAAAYQRQLDRLAVLDAPLAERQILQRVRGGEIALPVAVVLAGFEDVSPRLADWLAALREIGRASCRERVCQYV